MNSILVVCLLFLSFINIKVNGRSSRAIENIDSDAESLEELDEIHLHFHLNGTSGDKGAKGKDYQIYGNYPVVSRYRANPYGRKPPRPTTRPIIRPISRPIYYRHRRPLWPSMPSFPSNPSWPSP